MHDQNAPVNIPTLFNAIEKSQRALYEEAQKAYEELLENMAMLNDQKIKLEKELAFFRSKFREPNVSDKEPSFVRASEEFAPKVSENIF